jgi:hypothetical protein
MVQRRDVRGTQRIGSSTERPTLGSWRRRQRSSGSSSSPPPPQKTPGTFDTKRRDLKAAIERVMPDGETFAWVTGHEVESVFRSVYTGFFYPSMTVSLALGVRELKVR